MSVLARPFYFLKTKTSNMKQQKNSNKVLSQRRCPIICVNRTKKMGRNEIVCLYGFDNFSFNCFNGTCLLNVYTVKNTTVL